MTFHSKAKNLTVDTNVNTNDTNSNATSTPSTTASMTPSHNNNNKQSSNVLPTPKGIRGSSDLRSPGIQKTPNNTNTNNTNTNEDDMASSPLANFITQTDKYGNASTPRIPIETKQPDTIEQNGTDETDQSNNNDVDACDTLLDSLRMMCCCILPNEQKYYGQQPQTNNNRHDKHNGNGTQQTSTATTTPMKQILKEDVDVPHNICLLPEYSGNKKCLVLDLDETLVHSSFRAVAGADFVIPVQVSINIE